MPPPTDESDEPFQSEASFIHFLSAACADREMSVDFTDDCAHLQGHTALISTDTIVEDIHFECDTATPYQIGRQAAVVNLSDLAGSGGKPEWALLSLQLPPGWFGGRLRALCRGFLDELARSNTPLVGGNCCHASGPLAITVTVGGSLYGSRAIRRDGAAPGDYLYVSGTLGSSAMALAHPTPDNIALRHRWRPHLMEAKTLCEADHVTAMMDISDGLMIDAQRMAHASAVAFNIETSLLPEVPDTDFKTARNQALFGGEDYVLLFTLPKSTEPPYWAIRIGSVLEGHGVRLDGRMIDEKGFDHFQACAGEST